MECVSFDSAEEIVVAGATGGTVKLWDLEQAKGMHVGASVIGVRLILTLLDRKVCLCSLLSYLLCRPVVSTRYSFVAF